MTRPVGLISTIRRVIQRLKLSQRTVDLLKLPNTPAVWFTVAVVLPGMFSWPYITQSGPDLPSVSFVSSALALASLISIWCTVLGGWKAYLIGVPILLLDGWALSEMGPNGDWRLHLLPLGIAIPCFVTVEMLKLMFGKFVKLLPGDQVFEEGLQFKLSHMFIVTTMVAVFIGIGQAFGKNFSNQPSSMAWTLTVISVVLALQTLISIWAVLGRSFLLRLAIVFPTAILISVLGIYSMPGSGMERNAVWGIIFAVCFVSMLTLLSLLRWDW
ncbi:hypothetical protein OAG71_04465 [bacterium]|nr:hypothetical protein [bacterium]